MTKTTESMTKINIGWLLPFIHIAAYLSNDANLIHDCEQGDPYSRFFERAHSHIRHYGKTSVSTILHSALLAYLQGCNLMVGPSDKATAAEATAAAKECYPKYREWSKQVYKDNLKEKNRKPLSGGHEKPSLSLVTPENAGYGHIITSIDTCLPIAAYRIRQEVSKKIEVEVSYGCCLTITSDLENQFTIISSSCTILDDVLGGKIGKEIPKYLKRRIYIVEKSDYLQYNFFADMLDATRIHEILR